MLLSLRPALLASLWMTALCGVAYPLLVTGVGQLLFPVAARGSLVTYHDKVIGSELLAQPFDEPIWFHPRPSTVRYNAAGSGGSNYGVAHPDLEARAMAAVLPTTVDLITTSGSGLDPHLSPKGAWVQVERIAAARQLDPQLVKQLVDSHIEPRTFGVLGEPRVNVLRLNLALEEIRGTSNP